MYIMHVYSGNVHNACDTIVILFSLKMALGRKFGRTKTYNYYSGEVENKIWIGYNGACGF